MSPACFFVASHALAVQHQEPRPSSGCLKSQSVRPGVIAMKSVFHLVMSMLSGAVMAAFVTVYSASCVNKRVLKCQRIEIVDREGKSRVVIGVDDKFYGAGLQFLGKSGNEGILLRLGDDGQTSNLIFRDGETILLSAAANADQGSTLTLGDPGQSRMIVGAMPSDVPSRERASDWGIQIRGADSLAPVVSINVHTDSRTGLRDGDIGITHPNGKRSILP